MPSSTLRRFGVGVGGNTSGAPWAPASGGVRTYGDQASGGWVAHGRPFLVANDLSPWMRRTQFETRKGNLLERDLRRIDGGVLVSLVPCVSTGKQDAPSDHLHEASASAEGLGVPVDWYALGTDGSGYAIYDSGSPYASESKVRIPLAIGHDVAVSVGSVPAGVGPLSVNIDTGAAFYRVNLSSFWRMRSLERTAVVHASAGEFVSCDDAGDNPACELVDAATGKKTEFFLSNHETPFTSCAAHPRQHFWAEIGYDAGEPAARNYTVSSGNGWGKTQGHGYFGATELLGSSITGVTFSKSKGTLGQFIEWYGTLSAGDPGKTALLDAMLLAGGGKVFDNWTDGSWRGSTGGGWESGNLVSGSVGAGADLTWTSASDNLAMAVSPHSVPRASARAWEAIKDAVSDHARVRLQWGNVMYGGGGIPINLAYLPTASFEQKDNLMLDVALTIWKDATQDQWWYGSASSNGTSIAHYPLNMQGSLRAGAFPSAAAGGPWGIGMSLLASAKTSDARYTSADTYLPLGGPVTFTNTATNTWEASLPSWLSSLSCNSLVGVLAGTTFTLTMTFSNAGTRAAFSAAYGTTLHIGALCYTGGTESSNTIVWNPRLDSSTTYTMASTTSAGGTIVPANNMTRHRWLGFNWGVASATSTIAMAWGSGTPAPSGVMAPRINPSVLAQRPKLSGGYKTNSRTFTAGNTFVQSQQDHSSLSYVENLLDSYWYERLAKQFRCMDIEDTADALTPNAYSEQPPLWLARWGIEWQRYVVPATGRLEEVKDCCEFGAGVSGYKDHGSPTQSSGYVKTQYEGHAESVASWLKVARNLKPSMRIVPTIRALADLGVFGYQFMHPKEFAYWWARPWFVGPYAADGMWLWEGLSSYANNLFPSPATAVDSGVEKFRRGVVAAIFGGASMPLATYWEAATTASWDGVTRSGILEELYGTRALAMLGISSIEGTHASGASVCEVYVKQVLDLWARDVMAETVAMLAAPDSYQRPADTDVLYTKATFVTVPAIVFDGGDVVASATVQSTASGTATWMYKVSGGHWTILSTTSATIAGHGLSASVSFAPAAGTQVRALVKVTGTRGSSWELSNTLTAA